MKGFANRENWFLFASKSINLQCIEEISNIFHSIELDPKEASEIIIFLHKKYQIKRNDISPLIESQQKRLVQAKYEANFIAKKKKRQIIKSQPISKLVFAIKLTISYLDPIKDNLLSLLLINKEWNSSLSLLIYEKFLNVFQEDQKFKIKIWIKLLNPVKINKFIHKNRIIINRTHCLSIIMS